ncbi:reverse transcriptase [Caerostris darwini]|uniref:Reverse transcriptase n=1 Tax=Caerostris darwini TaxID=1538125 RepID=A0AAV4R0Y8_9ARAC|nr:reverse transcriptase [Caerostris darwini]
MWGTLEEAKELQPQLIAILQKVGMKPHNHSELSPNLKEDCSFSNSDENKTLGVSWKPYKDLFFFRVKVKPRTSCSKRNVLSTIARLFDPPGFVVAKAKIF